MRWWPRSIRWQMLLGLALLEALSIVLFATVLIRIQRNLIQERVEHRLVHQADSLAEQVEEGLVGDRADWIGLSVHMMGRAPSIGRVRITDPRGKTLFDSGAEAAPQRLSDHELSQAGFTQGSVARVFALPGGGWESVKAIYQGSKLYGYGWIESERSWDIQELSETVRGTALFGLIWVVASLLLAWVLSRGVSGPLAILHRGTRELVSMPDSAASFPLPVDFDNEVGDLIEAFNGMVAGIEEQRAGLRDTLSLLDSMLANAPIGFAFFDRYARFVRVNQVFADMTGIPLSRHLGRTPDELLSSEIAGQLGDAVRSVFASENPVADLEFHGTGSGGPWTWMVSAYPVRTAPDQLRWVGIIVRDVSERVRSEEALRKTEKLAATGRLAASIAHEINNPLEALMNLLYLLREFGNLEGQSREFVSMAEQQARRIAEIAQKTLRFYRQSTLPARTRVADLLDSILDLYAVRMNTLDIHLDREVDNSATLFCFEGEVRQVLSNLIDNAIDATSGGGRMVVRARLSRDWSCAGAPAGIRITIADTGSGMAPDVRSRIFEAFFTTKDDTGTGLGLWVSMEIIQKHRARIHVRSRTAASGRPSGSVFQLFIPDGESVGTRTPESSEVAGGTVHSS
jgi:PAS domain S-box-containing protein